MTALFANLPRIPRASAAVASPVEHLLENSTLRLSLSAAQRQELQSLNQELNPQLQAEALLDFGRRLEREENFGAAIEVYSTLVGAEYQPLRNRARTKLNALLGTGPW